MHIIGTHHIALHTTNFARLRHFYTEILGLRIVGGFPGENIIFLEAGNTLIELEEVEEQHQIPDSPGTRNKPGWDHLAFEVDNVDAAFRHLTTLGVQFHAAPANYPAEKAMIRIAFLTDPDGNTIELLQSLM